MTLAGAYVIGFLRRKKYGIGMHLRGSEDKDYRSVCACAPTTKTTDRYALARRGQRLRISMCLRAEEKRATIDMCLRAEEKGMDWYALAR